MMMTSVPTQARNRGFTLISLMIVVAIIGILAAIAYPSYTQYVRKSRRSEAISMLTRAANEQAQYYTMNQDYADDMDDLNLLDETEGKWYAVSIVSSTTDGFKIKADAQNGQENDDCKQFYIDATGSKWVNSANKSNSTKAANEECW